MSKKTAGFIILPFVLFALLMLCSNPTSPFDKPNKLLYVTNPAVYTIGTPIVENQTAINGKAPFTFSSAPALPPGLMLNASSGTISGTPTDTARQKRFIITATNSLGSTICTLTISVFQPKPTAIIYATNPAVYTVNTPILDNTLVVTGGIPDKFSVSPALPSGLRLDSITGAIKGTPVQAKGFLAYTVRAENSQGYVEITLIVTVNAATCPQSNQPPRWTHNNITDTLFTGQALVLSLSDSCRDPEGKAVNFSLLAGNPATDSIVTGNLYRYTPPLADSGNYTVRILGTDDSLACDTLVLSLRIRQVDHDSTGPTMRRLDPPNDSITSSSSSRTIKVIAKDISAVQSVSFVLGTNTMSGVKSDDSVWTATISGFQANVFNTITATATDNSLNRNQSSLALHIKYDPTALDNTSPDIVLVNGVLADSVIYSNVITTTVAVTDDSGVDSVFWTLNGTYAGVMSPVTGQQSQYRLTGTLTKYDTNKVVITAVDKSTARNRATRTVTIIYRTKPSTVTAVAPALSATGVENTGLKYIWRMATCADGRTVTYVVKYGTADAALSSAGETVDSSYTPVPALKGNTQYFWQILSIAGNDTVVSPTAGTFTFLTKDHPATFTRALRDTAASINDTVVLSLIASDAEGIDKYQWDFGGTIVETTIGSVSYKTPATSGNVNVILTVVDKTGGTTKDTARVTVTNNTPVANAGRDTLIGLHKPLLLHGTGTDDCRIVKYEWAFSSWGTHILGSFTQTATGDTTIYSPAENLPDSIMAILRVTDEDGNQGKDTIKIKANMIWKCATMNADWSVRSGHSTLVFNNALFLMAGCKFDTGWSELADVWKSYDGISWTKLSDSAGFGKRAFAGADTFSGTMRIVNGSGELNAYMTYHDMWSSPDGIHWSQCNLGTGDLSYSVGSTCTNYKNYLWLLGGSLYPVTGAPAMATSMKLGSGCLWTNNSGVFPSRSGHATVVYKDTLWCIGGYLSEGYAQNDVVFTTDGNNWNTRTDNPPFSVRYGLSAIVAADRMWIISGGKMHDIWYSNDGLGWKCATNAAGFSGRQFQSSVFFQGKIWVLGGYDGMHDLNDVWYSDDLP